MTARLRLAWGTSTHTGRVRPGNEDAAFAEEGLFIVADGMGGHAAGEIASQVAVEAVRASLGDDGLVEAVRVANRAVLDRAARDPKLRGMGTTLCAVALVDDTARVDVVNVGDSRVYLFRDSELLQLTEDHNLVAELEREGRITAEEAKVHPQRNIITRVLGNDPNVEVDTFPVDVLRGDRFLLCSDGLFNEVADDTIAAVLRTEPDPQAVVDELVRLALAAGGRDNITVVVVDVLDDGGRAEEASAALAGVPSTSTATRLDTAREPAEPAEPAAAVTVPAERAHGEPDELRPRRVTWRSVLFTLVVLAVVVAAVGSVWWFARNTWYVGVDDERVAIFRGRPGGVLWIDPTLERRYETFHIDDVPVWARDDVLDGKQEPSRERAERYVANLRERAERRSATTTTTTTSTTVFPPPTFAPGTTPPSPAP